MFYKQKEKILYNSFFTLLVFCFIILCDICLNNKTLGSGGGFKRMVSSLMQIIRYYSYEKHISISCIT